MFLDTSFDIKNIICLYLYDLKDTINLYNLNKDHQDNVRITNLYNISEHIYKLNQKIIEQNKYRCVEKLYAFNNEKIKNVNHMKKTLKKLNCSGYSSGIDQNGISQLNLIELRTSNNKKIQNVNHMKRTLKILLCRYNSGIDQNGILELNLIFLMFFSCDSHFLFFHYNLHLIFPHIYIYFVLLFVGLIYLYIFF